MYTLELGVFMYKYSINDLPVAFKEYFMKRSDIHDYPTRHVNNLNLTNNRKSFRTNGPILWNSLSKTIRESKSVKHFRNQFKQNLIKTYEKFWIFGHVLSCPKSCLVFRCQIVSFPFYVFLIWYFSLWLRRRLLTGLIGFPVYSSIRFFFCVCVYVCVCVCVFNNCFDVLFWWK